MLFRSSLELTIVTSQAELDAAYQSLVTIVNSKLKNKEKAVAEEKAATTEKTETTTGKPAENTKPAEGTNAIANTGKNDPRNGKEIDKNTAFRADTATATGIGADVVDATSTPKVEKPGYTTDLDAKSLTSQITWLDFGDVANWTGTTTTLVPASEVKPTENLQEKMALQVGATYTKEIMPGYVVTIKVKSLKPFQATEIYVAAKKGDPDPESNSALKFVIDRAKQAQVPKHVIDKAIDKAKGNTDETFTEGRYEGFGPNGSMLIVDTLTSNVNRTAANVRAAFGKNGGNMGASGSVSYLFDNKGVIVFAGDDADAIFELLLEADVDVDDVEAEEGTITVYTAPTDLHKAIVALRESGIEEFQVTELEMIPQSEVELSGEDLETFEKLYSVLEDDEDVQKIYTNVDGF